MRMLISLCSVSVLAIVLPMANMASAAGWDAPANFLFTADIGGSTVTVINVTEDRVVGQLTTQYPIDDIAASGFGDYAFASHAEARKVTVINLHRGKIEGLVPVSIKPRHLTFEQNSGLVMTDSVDGGMAMLDSRGGREVFSNRDIPPSRDIIFGPTGIVAYYHSGETGTVGAVAMDSGRSLWRASIPASSQGVPLVRSLDGLFIVVVLPDTGQVQALLAANGKHIGTLHLGQGLSRPYVTANGQYFLVADEANRQMHVLSQTHFTRLASITSAQAGQLVTSGLFDVMAVAYANSTLYAMDLLKLGTKPVHEMPIRGQASDVIVTSDSKHAYAAIPSANAIAHLNLRSGELSYIEDIESPTIVTMGVSNAVCH